MRLDSLDTCVELLLITGRELLIRTRLIQSSTNSKGI